MPASEVWRKVFVERFSAKPAKPAHFVLMDEERNVLDEPADGVPNGVISDADEDHNLFAEFGIFYKSPTVEAPADAAEPRLEPAPEGVDEAELNVQAAAAADPAAAGLLAGPPVTATAPAAAPPTAANALAAFAALL